MMALTKQKTGWASPKFTIDCLLANVGRQLEADGCVLEFSATGCTPITPDQMAVGDFVKVQLWLESEESFVDIRLAEVRQVRDHWIGLEVIQVSQNDRMKLKRLIDTPTAMRTDEPAFIDHLLVRA
jgi:hypothetical protein